MASSTSTRILPALVVVLLAPCVVLAQTLVPGRVVGDLKLINASSAVVSHCTSDPAVSPGGLPPIVLRPPTQTTIVARTTYGPVNTSAGADFTLGSYDIGPAVDSFGSTFTISAENVQFANGAQYRFGSRYPGGVGASFCSGVFPVTVNSSGTRCDQRECAVLVNVNFHLVADPIDPAALGLLDTGTFAPPAICKVTAAITDAGGVDDQAISATATPAMSSINGSARQTIPILVRGNTPLRITTSCSAPVSSGQTNGFVIIPGTAVPMTPVSSTQVLTFNCALTGTPTAASSVNFDLPVARTAGSIKGQFDLIGRTEDTPHVRIGEPASLFMATPQTDPLNPTGPLIWQLDGVPSAISPVTAWTFTDQKDKFVIFPARDGLNLGVPISRGATTDLKATFVAKPREVNGRVTLFDNGQADLGTLVTGPFGVNELYQRTSSHAAAAGNDGLPETGGASAIRGASRARLVVQTPYSTTTGKTDLTYALLLPGIWLATCSTVGGPACNTSWDFSGIYLMLRPPGNNSEYLNIEPASLLRVDTGSPTFEPKTAPDESYCIGRLDLSINVNPSVGALFAPTASIGSNSTIQPEIVPGTTPVSSATGYISQGTTATQKAPTVKLPINLIAGIGYRITPSVQFAPATGTAPTTAYIPAMTVPVTGVMPCSQKSVCVTSGGPSGPYTALSIDILDETGTVNPSYCLASTTPSLTVKVNSANPTSVSYAWDPAAGSAGCPSTAQILCSGGSCTPNPQFSVPVPALTAGLHTLRACANDTGGLCTVSQDFPFRVVTQNLALSCPAPITVTLNPGEASIARSDPRLAALRATVTGNCGIPPAITDDAPDSFTAGTTTVHFTAPNIGSCTTTVTVQPPNLRQIGVKAMRATQVLEIYRTTNPNATLTQQVVVGNGFEYAFSPDGRRVAIVRRDGTTGVVDLSSGVGVMSLINTAASSLVPPFGIAWYRDGRSYAIIGRASTTNAAPTVKVYRTTSAGTPSLQQTYSPAISTYATPAQLTMNAIAYSQDSDRIVIAGAGQLPAQVQYAMVVFSADTDTTGRIVTSPTPQVIATLPVTQANREEVHEISASSGLTFITTTRRLYRISTGGFPNQVFMRANYDAAISVPPKIVALSEQTGTQLRAVLINPAASGSSVSSAPYGFGRTKGEIAIAGDAKNIAVVAQDGIVIYDDTFARVSSIPDSTMSGIRFRPGT